MRNVFRRTSLPALAALTLALAPALALGQANGKLQIHHVNVGQGDGVLLISPLGQTALFDTGNYLSCTGIKNYLQGLGITVVDYHFASHYHSDHIGCIDDLAAIGITIGTQGYDRGSSYSSGVYTAYVNTLGSKRATIAKNQTITLDAGSANPVLLKCVDLNGAGVYSPSGSDENAKSLVMKVTYGNFDEVIGGDLTGDGSTDVETTVGPATGDVEVYKVHHHGSLYSSNDNWLDATLPEVAIIQVGNNSYGHPTADALGRMHAHGTYTYWTQTGSGASPNGTWDTVAGGTIVVEADPGPGAAYTVSGPGFDDTFYNDGVAPPIETTEVAEGIVLTKGSITVGDYTRLAANDASRVSISAGVTGGQYLTDWYGTVTLDHPPLNLAITYDGNYTVSRTQTLYLWNWTTSAWVQIDQATVSTTDVTRTWSTGSPGNYVNASRQVRLRVATNTRNSSFTCRGDYMAFTYDYTPGTLPRPVERALALGAPARALHPELPLVAYASAPASPAAVVADARPAARDAHLTVGGAEQPLAALRSAEARWSTGGATLTWTVPSDEHVDGFNVYRESSAGLSFVGNESSLETAEGIATFRFVDASAADATVYWLGARGCSGPETLIGPLRLARAASGSASVDFALRAAPNPAAAATTLRFTVPFDTRGRLDLYDVTGRRIATPYAGALKAGAHEIAWDLAGASGRVSPGVYFARLEAAGRTVLARVTVTER
jgi:beta-lactamase superfamily II metal-dependent hydrolase